MENRYRSLFWPVVLIGIGLVWLLSNLGIIQTGSTLALLRLWPVLLILAGIDLLFSRRWPWLGALLGLLTLAGVIALLVAAPSLGILQSPEAQTKTIAEPLGQARQAQLNLDMTTYPTRLTRTSGDQLISGEIDYVGDLLYTVGGGETPAIQIAQVNDPAGWFDWTSTLGQDMRWDLALNDQVEWDLVIDGGSGSSELDLTGLTLTGFQADFGSGSSQVRLPATAPGYDARIDSGSGSLRLWLPAETDLNLELDSGSGSVTLTLPEGAAVQLIVADGGSGSLNLPRDLDKISGDPDEDEGTWETAGFAQAAQQITLRLDYGSGSVTLRYD
jgi:hypothetical protein